MAEQQKPAPAATPAKHENAPPHHKPHIGAIVHFYDEGREAFGSQIGKGPYAATVTAIGMNGLELFVMGPKGGRFDAPDVKHKNDVADQLGKKRWWEWPSR